MSYKKKHRRKKKCKHQWRKVGATYSKSTGLRTTKKRCIKCGEVKDVV